MSHPSPPVATIKSMMPSLCCWTPAPPASPPRGPPRRSLLLALSTRPLTRPAPPSELPSDNPFPCRRCPKPKW